MCFSIKTSNILSRPLFRGVFSSDDPQETDNDDHKKIKLLERRVEQLGISGLTPEHISYALRSPHAHGDLDRAFDLLLLLQDSIEGIIRGYTPKTKLLGAENRSGVTCYLDALLFAMFARLDCFEAILYKSFSDEPRRKLAVLLRLWVNMLRSGKLITADLTTHLQDALAQCGWEDAAQLRQQDASEAFTFITGTLELPLLTLKMDIYHTGKEDEASDHKFVNERLLEVAIPEPVEGKTITLEDCLESYFNNRIEVKRHLERRNTVGSMKSFDSTSKGFTAHVEAIELSPTTTSPTPSSPRFGEINTLSSFTEFSESASPSTEVPRRNSIVQERFIPDSKHDTNGDGGLTPTPQSRKGSYRKEVMMPAWQFFSLIPWYTDNSPTNDAQVAAHFSSRRPILGMCLKRYSVLPNGKAVRLSTYVDIPTEIGLPHFIQDDSMDADGPIYGNFKLSLQALVCHRGNSVESGHYIAIVRGTSAGASPDGSNSNDQDTSDSSRYWMRFDDLAAERVTLVDIEQALKHESPYLLFYQILPVHEDAAEANLQNKPPSSDLSEDLEDLDAAGITRKLLGLSVGSSDDRNEESVSGRPSFEITGPDNEELETPGRNERKQSVAFSESVDPPGSTGSLQVVSSSSPKLVAKDDDGKGALFNSSRGSRANRSNPGSRTGSRAGSQTSESRISATFSRFTGRRSRDKPSSDGHYTENEGEGDDLAADNELRSQSGERSMPASDEGKEKSSRGRTKDRDKGKGKSKEKSREKTAKRLERECVVM
ncbi:hypothetical protein MW887_007062 [Aspergillus wentii]|nr:hypothetical protein MW887_007062 [Aspergillus wentii]